MYFFFFSHELLGFTFFALVLRKLSLLRLYENNSKLRKFNFHAYIIYVYIGMCACISISILIFTFVSKYCIHHCIWLTNIVSSVAFHFSINISVYYCINAHTYYI